MTLLLRLCARRRSPRFGSPWKRWEREPLTSCSRASSPCWKNAKSGLGIAKWRRNWWCGNRLEVCFRKAKRCLKGSVYAGQIARSVFFLTSDAQKTHYSYVLITVCELGANGLIDVRASAGTLQKLWERADRMRMGRKLDHEIYSGAGANRIAGHDSLRLPV